MEVKGNLFTTVEHQNDRGRKLIGKSLTKNWIITGLPW